MTILRHPSPSLLVALLLSATAAPAAESPPDFRHDIAPLLERHCLDCHGPEKQRGGTRYDRRDAAFAPGDSGAPAIVPGKPDESELLARLVSTHEDERMPPKGERLAEAEVARIRDWIAAGADWPDTTSTEARETLPGADHWSFQPVLEPTPPEVADAAWAEHPIDRFLEAGRRTAGLSAVAPAEPGALLRRVSYDLTGLPPAPEEVAKFLEESTSPETLDAAYERAVDRLLASSAYGERWARHWLDWARYADTAGDNSDFPIPQAYLYRNYVIDALNVDLPYDRFLVEQLAGDLLPADDREQRNRQTIATGYLALSRRFGSLVERYPQHLTIEDTIDNLGRTVLGLTISCARCHDHKFDPISTRDYYGLYGFFASTRYPFPGIELFQTQRHFVPLVDEKEVEKTWGPFEEEARKLAAELDRLLAEAEAKALENASLEGKTGLDEQRRRRDELDGMLLRARKAGTNLAAHLRERPLLPSAYAVQDAEPANARVQVRGEPERPGAEVPRKFPEVLGGMELPEEIARSGSGRLELAQWIAGAENPLTARVIVNRVWQRHFGVGLVPGDGDFGLRGEAPTHPGLLDWLAADFVRHGWSLKRLHRQIATSRSYRLSSADDAAALAADPDNRAYWRFPRQRLDAESLRDTLLLLGGQLDLSPQTEPHPFPPMKEWKFTQHHPFKADYPTRKRSVYQMVKRLTADPYGQTFDSPDPNACTSRRDRSVTSLQALFFFNDALVHEAAEGFAKGIAASGQDDAERLERACLAALARRPEPEEAELLLAHLAEAREATGQEEAAWASVGRSILRLNEFLYID